MSAFERAARRKTRANSAVIAARAALAAAETEYAAASEELSLLRADKRAPLDVGFVVTSGRMSSLGSSGATFIGHGSTRDVSAYRSTSGVGAAHRGSQ